MNVQSKEFWEKVKKEYNPEINKFICVSSNTFAEEWYSNMKSLDIKILAKKFLIHSRLQFKYWGVQIGSDSIFLGKSKKIRIKFIDWCIKEYSK